jgi:hypothetical protein
VVTDWWMEKGKVDIGSAIRLCAACKAAILLIVRRWYGVISPLSSELSDSMSESGISSSSSPSSSSSFMGATCFLLLPFLGSDLCIVGSLGSVRLSSPSLELSLSSMRSKSN